MIGCLVGAAGGFHASVKGLPIAKLATPALVASGFAFTGVAGAVVAALSAAAVGCEFGAKAGAKIDLMLFDNFRCSNCQRTFKT